MSNLSLLKACFMLYASCFMLVSCASSQVSQLQDQNRKLDVEINRLRDNLDKLGRARAEDLRKLEASRSSATPPEGYPPPDALGSSFTPPPYVGFTERPPVGWGDAGNEGRSVKLSNDWNPYRRYYLRIFLDNEEVGFTDGVAAWQSVIQTPNGPKSISLLRPNGQGMLRVGHGEHHILVEQYSCDDYDCEFSGEVCEWRVNFDRIRGPWHFFGGDCHKTSPAN